MPCLFHASPFNSSALQSLAVPYRPSQFHCFAIRRFAASCRSQSYLFASNAIRHLSFPFRISAVLFTSGTAHRGSKLLKSIAYPGHTPLHFAFPEPFPSVMIRSPQYPSNAPLFHFPAAPREAALIRRAAVHPFAFPSRGLTMPYQSNAFLRHSGKGRITPPALPAVPR